MQQIKLKGECSGLVYAVLVLLVLAVLGINPVNAARIKDIASIKGVRDNQILGYGLVVGLNGTGDKDKSVFTMQSLANLMRNMGVKISKDGLKVKNTAGVLITATIPPFARLGSKIDVMVSSIGDAKSLSGGTLLMTPMKGIDGKIYAIAQGSITIGGAGTGSTTKNHLLAARISSGATIEREIPVKLDGKDKILMALYNPDFTTSLRIEEIINSAMGKGVADALDSGAVTIFIPENRRSNVAKFIADIETLNVVPDSVAKIVVNEKTGTIVIGENVSISTVAVAHGNLMITVRESEEVSQPNPFGSGDTVVTAREDVDIQEEENKVMMLPSGTTIGDLVRALNAIGVSPRDLISIFQSIKAMGSLQAEIEVI